MQDLRKGPPPDNGLEVMYASASFNDHMLGHGEPIRVRQGERVLFRLLNASATENIRLALPGHHFTILRLDGNPVPTRQTVDVLSLAVAERVDVVVEMNYPSVWIRGEHPKDGTGRRGRIRQTMLSALHGRPVRRSNRAATAARPADSR